MSSQPVRLHVISGKGGTGKSTVAAALAIALAAQGRNVLLCEVEGRQGIARMFDTDPLPYAETRIATGISALHLDAESALLEYLAMYYRLGRAGKALEKFGVISFATTIAPGVRDVLLTGKVYEAVDRNSRNKGAVTYDAVILDAPPTGRITQFLGVTNELAGLAKVGPIKAQSDKVMGLLQSPATRVHLVTLLEEMPVQETADAIEELTAAGLPVGQVIINQVRPDVLPDAAEQAALAGTLDPLAIAADLKAAGVDADEALVDGLILEAKEYSERQVLESEQRRAVVDLGLPTVELPRIPGGVDRAGLQELADLLSATSLVTTPADHKQKASR